MSSKLLEASRLTAISQYLSSLKTLQLVSPSIGLPYPRQPTEEKMIVHRALLDVQNLRLLKIEESISQLKTEHNLVHDDIINNETFKEISTKLKSRIQFLKKKFCPTIIPTHNIQRKKRRNRNSRERFLSRKLRKNFSNGNGESVIMPVPDAECQENLRPHLYV